MKGNNMLEDWPIIEFFLDVVMFARDFTNYWRSTIQEALQRE